VEGGFALFVGVGVLLVLFFAEEFDGFEGVVEGGAVGVVGGEA